MNDKIIKDVSVVLLQPNSELLQIHTEVDVEGMRGKLFRWFHAHKEYWDSLRLTVFSDIGKIAAESVYDMVAQTRFFQWLASSRMRATTASGTLVAFVAYLRTRIKAESAWAEVLFDLSSELCKRLFQRHAENRISTIRLTPVRNRQQDPIAPEYVRYERAEPLINRFAHWYAPIDQMFGRLADRMEGRNVA